MNRSRMQRGIKRTLDIVLSAAALVLLFPLLALIAIAVFAVMGRPVFFRQPRPGLNGRAFMLVKFRTMHQDRNGARLSDAERLTRLGSILRVTSLDELPELWNVLKGDMSLVGPRPLLVEYLPYYSYEERQRHRMRPGITGLSQVTGRNTMKWDERLQKDLWYVNNYSLFLDFKILALTVVKVFSRKGALVDPRAAMQDLNVERRDVLAIRRLSPRHAKEAVSLLKRALPPSDWSHTILQSPRVEGFFRDVLMDRDQFWGSFRDGKLVGVLQVRAAGAGIHINNFAVDEVERGYGVADLLFDTVTEMFGQVPADLLVSADNKRAIRFYQRMGFTEVGRHRQVEVTLGPAEAEDLELDNPQFRPADPRHLRRYGFGYLQADGRANLIGIILPRQLNLPDSTDADIFHAVARAYPGAVLRAPYRLHEELPHETPRTIHTKIRMARL